MEKVLECEIEQHESTSTQSFILLIFSLSNKVFSSYIFHVLMQDAL